MFGRATITLGIDPHSSFNFFPYYSFSLYKYTGLAYKKWNIGTLRKVCSIKRKHAYVYGMSSFHFYHWNQFKVIPLACTLRTRNLPKFSAFANFQSGDTSPLINDLLNKSATVSEISSSSSTNILVPTKSTPVVCLCSFST